MTTPSTEPPAPVRPRAAALALVALLFSGVLGGCAAGIVFGDDEDDCPGQRTSQGECQQPT